MQQSGWISERGGGLFKFASERGGTQKKVGGGGVPQKKGVGVPTLEETMWTDKSKALGKLSKH